MDQTESAKAAWQASVGEAKLPSLEAMRTASDRFYRLIRRRNRIEYVASVLVVVVFTAYVFLLPSPVARIGAAMVVIGTLVMTWQLYRRASPAEPPAAETALPLIVHQRAQLVRQHEALAKIGRWYILPFMPGLLLMILAPVVEAGPQVLRHFSAANFVSVAVVGLIVGGIWWLNRRAARRLRRAIDELDALRREPG